MLHFLKINKLLSKVLSLNNYKSITIFLHTLRNNFEIIFRIVIIEASSFLKKPLKCLIKIIANNLEQHHFQHIIFSLPVKISIISRVAENNISELIHATG